MCHDQHMNASDAAKDERRDLAALLDDVGPDAPTLCEGWTTRDLAAHLVIREGRPDAAIGVVVGPLAGYTAKVQAATADKPWPDLVRQVRNGPPIYSPFRIPGMDGVANLFEYAIHHEDVRRAVEGWQPRELPADEQDLIWSRLSRAGRLLARRSPDGLALRRSDTGETTVLKKGATTVTLVGEPLEMLLRLYGRRAVVLDVTGDEAAVQRFEKKRFGV